MLDYLMASVDEDDTLTINSELFYQAKNYVPCVECKFDFAVQSRIQVDPMFRSSLTTHLSADHFLNLPY